MKISAVENATTDVLELLPSRRATAIVAMLKERIHYGR